MLDNHIGDEEHLFRAVVLSPSHYQDGRVTSAAFKDSKGVSVDRQGPRGLETCIIELHERIKPIRGIVYLKAGKVRELGAFAKYDPDPILPNEFHSLILKSDSEIHLSSGTARRLANAAQQKIFIEV